MGVKSTGIFMYEVNILGGLGVLYGGKIEVQV